jgi:hypothetical protein
VTSLDTSRTTDREVRVDTSQPTNSPLPSFLIIGAQKSATRWLRANLGEHPEICTAREELAFFNIGKRYRQGFDWYRHQFMGWRGEPIVGEATPGYMMMRHRPEVVAKRITRVMPDARLIAILRNPVDRAQSALVHHIRRGRLPHGTRLTDLIRDDPKEAERLSLIAGGLYYESLEPFFQRFGDRLLVIIHDDVALDPEPAFTCVLRHIGASDHYVPRNLREVRFSNQGRPSRPGRRGGHTAPEPLTPEDRVELFESRFRRDVERLEERLGRDLSCWLPDASSATVAEHADDHKR